MSASPPTVFGHPGPPPPLPERPEGAPPRPERSPAGEPPDRWGPWFSILSLISALLVVAVCGLIGGGIATAFGADVEDEPTELLISLTYVQDLVFVAAAIFFARILAGMPAARDFGMVRPRHLWAAIGLVVAVQVGFYMIAAAWIAALGEDPEEELPDELGADESDVALGAVLVLVTVMAPIGEEVLFRGFMFRALRNWRGVWPAAILTGAIFGSIHLGSADAVALLPLAVLGFGLCLLYHWTGSLYPCIVLHAINNSVAFSISQDWDWQIPVVVVGSTTASVLLALLLARALDRARKRADREPEPA